MGIIDNETKKFRLEATLSRDTLTIKTFIKKFIGYGKTIVSDGWSAYSWIDDNNSGYSHITHIHGGGDFGFGISSTLNSKSFWNAFKSKIKTTYHTIRSKKSISFLPEAEWKYINRKKNNFEK